MMTCSKCKRPSWFLQLLGECPWCGAHRPAFLTDPTLPLEDD